MVLEGRAADHFAQLISGERKLSFRRHRRVLLAQGPGGGIARVYERPPAGPHLPVIELVEGADRHIDLAPHFDHFGVTGPSREGTAAIVPTLAVTSSPSSPLPLVAARLRRPSS